MQLLLGYIGVINAVVLSPVLLLMVFVYRFPDLLYPIAFECSIFAVPIEMGQLVATHWQDIRLPRAKWALRQCVVRLSLGPLSSFDIAYGGNNRHVRHDSTGHAVRFAA